MHKVMPLLLRELAVASNTPPGAQAQGAARSAVSLCLPTLLEASNSVALTNLQGMELLLNYILYFDTPILAASQYICPIHTKSGCGKREAHIIWSMVLNIPEKGAPITGTTLRTTGSATAVASRQ